MPPRAIIETLDKIWAVLESLGLPIALVGGLALAAWKHVRATQDVDILVAAGLSSEDPLVVALTRTGFRTKRKPPIQQIGAMRILQLEYDPVDTYVTVQVDLLLVESDYHREALERSVSLDIPEMERAVRVLSCEDLILHKLLAGRIIDRADVIALITANHDLIDRQYLGQWATRQQLDGDLARLWNEAMPSEPW